MASDQPTSAASPASPGNERSTSPTTASSTGPAAVATTIESPTPTPIWRARETRQDHRPAGVDRRQRGRPVAGGERQPAVRREVGAADRDGVEAGAVEGEVERRDRRRPGHAVDRRDLRSVAVAADRRRRDGREDLVARHDVGQPGGRRGPGVDGDGAQRDDHREAHDERPDRGRRSCRVARDRGAREPLLEAQHAGEREARDPPERTRAARASRGRPRAGRRRRRSCARTATPTRPVRGTQERGQDADDGHHDEQPARVRTHAGRGVRAGPEGLDGADGAGATRRLERGDERDHDAGADRGHEDRRR